MGALEIVFAFTQLVTCHPVDSHPCNGILEFLQVGLELREPFRCFVHSLLGFGDEFRSAT